MSSSRREFVKTTSVTAAAAVATPLALIANRAYAGGSDTVNVGLIGAGGRGTGACNDALRASDGVRITAIGDIFAAKCRNARNNLSDHGDRVAVSDDAIHEGLDAYRKVIHHPGVDMVILTTPPGFRPLHLAEAVKAGKHIFAEKPVCVDAAGYRSCIESARQARAQGTAIVTGTMYRRQPSYMEAVQRVHDGAIGRITSAIAYYCSAGIWYRPRQPGQSDLEYQLNNWYHFLWLCGDQIVEQAVHNIDAVNWTMGGPPLKAYGSGGQMTRPADSEIYDHMSIDFEYANGANVSFKCRQIPNSLSRVINTFVGTRGVAHINPGDSWIDGHDGTLLYEHEGRGNNPYVKEHEDLISSIHSGDPIVELEQTADSSLTAVMGRLAAYSGQEVTWDFAKNSKEDTFPKDFESIVELPSHGVPVPGQFKLI